MSPRQRQSNARASTTSSAARRGATPQESKSRAADGRTEPLSVRSILIEPRDNEPPRVSISVEYENKAPTIKQLKAAAMEVVHDVVRAQTFVDLGERQNVQRGELTKTFECREKGST